jgi:recombination protein RecA
MSKQGKTFKLIEQINKKYGEDTARDPKKMVKYKTITTGSLGLDLALGIGGLPYGKIVEAYGWESTGKTTFVYHAMAADQAYNETLPEKDRRICVFIDTEHSCDPQYARALGVDTDKWIWVQPQTAENALNIYTDCVGSGDCSIVALDSVAALVPESELNGEVGDNKIGLVSRLMGQHMRVINGAASRNNVLSIFINQLREKIGVMFGNPETTTGGNALKFYASIRMEFYKQISKKVMDSKSGDQIGNMVRVKVVKNKLAPPFNEATFEIIYGKGINKLGEIRDIGVELEVIEKSGNSYSYGDLKLGVGKAKVAQFLEDNIEFQKELLERIENKLKE